MVVVRTMATASLRMLSPKTNMFSTGSTSRAEYIRGQWATNGIQQNAAEFRDFITKSGTEIKGVPSNQNVKNVYNNVDFGLKKFH